MNSFELNKIAMALLIALLVLIGLNNLSEVVFHQDPMEANAYPIEVASVASADADIEEDTGPPLAVLLQTASVEKGENVFKKCKVCHTPEKGGRMSTGPNLWNIVNRDVGSAEGFNYSDAMSTREGLWDYEFLNDYLLRPKDVVPGTKMVFAGLKKAGDRADILLYLRSLSDVPVDLPVAEVIPEIEPEVMPEGDVAEPEMDIQQEVPSTEEVPASISGDL
ncbi:MAG: cytochrome c family protein [Proteobacteria bacterium]|nr:cytochrome c family protein [Pseudomonadota bacterium]